MSPQEQTLCECMSEAAKPQPDPARVRAFIFGVLEEMARFERENPGVNPIKILDDDETLEIWERWLELSLKWVAEVREARKGEV